MFPLRKAAAFDCFSQNEENVPESLHRWNPMFPIQTFVFEASCENLFEIPCFSSYKYLNSPGSFHKEARPSQDSTRAS